MIRACDGHRGHGETGCGFSTSTWPGGECPMCGGAMVDAPVPAPPAPRRPVAGWALTEAGALRLHAIGPDALAWFAEGTWNWCILGTAAMGQAPTLEAAQLAAEDTLRAVLVDAAAALGLRVVPS